VIVNPQTPTLSGIVSRKISDDILHQQRRANPNIQLDFSEQIFNQALMMIEDLCFRRTGKLLRDLGMTIVPDRSVADATNSDILHETNYNLEDLNAHIERDEPRLVPDQRSVYNEIVSSALNRDGKCFFIDAPGGTGKTFVLNLILAPREEREEDCCCMRIFRNCSNSSRGSSHSSFDVYSRGTAKLRGTH